MRESFGGAFMIKLVLIFIVIYVSFMAVAVNYAKTFRVKNGVINILEQNQYSNDDSLDEVISAYMQESHQIISDPERLSKVCDGRFITEGVCIEKKGNDVDPYYKVTVYIDIALPFFKLHLTVPVSGETEALGDWRKIS